MNISQSYLSENVQRIINIYQDKIVGKHNQVRLKSKSGIPEVWQTDISRFEEVIFAL